MFSVDTTIGLTIIILFIASFSIRKYIKIQRSNSDYTMHKMDKNFEYLLDENLEMMQTIKL